MIGLSCLSAQARSSCSRPCAASSRSKPEVPPVVPVDHHDVGELGEEAPVGRRQHHVDETRRDGSGRAGGALRTAARSRPATPRCATRARSRRSTARRSDGSCPERPAPRSPAGGPAWVSSFIVSAAEGDPITAEEQAAADGEVEADGGGLVDDDDAVPVGVVEHLLGIRVVRRAERVGADPVQEREVVHHRDRVVALAPHADDPRACRSP